LYESNSEVACVVFSRRGLSCVWRCW